MDGNQRQHVATHSRLRPATAHATPRLRPDCCSKSSDIDRRSAGFTTQSLPGPPASTMPLSWPRTRSGEGEGGAAQLWGGAAGKKPAGAAWLPWPGCVLLTAVLWL